MIVWIAVADAVFDFIFADAHDSHCGAICVSVHPLCPALVSINTEGLPFCQDFPGGSRDPEAAPAIATSVTSRQTVDGVSLCESSHLADHSFVNNLPLDFGFGFKDRENGEIGEF